MPPGFMILCAEKWQIFATFNLSTLARDADPTNNPIRVYNEKKEDLEKVISTSFPIPNYFCINMYRIRINSLTKGLIVCLGKTAKPCILLYVCTRTSRTDN